MSSNLDANKFKCVDDNKSYTFIASLYTGELGEDDGLNAGLDANDIVEFMYESRLNGLLLTGHIIYTDKYARVDKFMCQHLAYCQVLMYENETSKDGDFGIQKIDKVHRFKHNFIISAIKIIARDQGIIQYRIELVSNNWFKCIANISYSNYDKAPQELFSILKACFADVDLKTDEVTFSKVKSSVALNYITNANDCMISIADYLLPKTFYYDIRDNAMKFLLYNESTDMFQLLDITDKQTATGVFSEVVSFFKTDTEGLVQPNPINLGYIKKTVDKTDIYKGMFTYDMHDFSFDQNEFSVTQIGEQETVKFMNERFIDDKHASMYTQMFPSTLEHKTIGSYWNNMQCIYDDVASAFQQGNTFVVNTKGDILRKPGSIMNLVLDRSMKNMDTMSKSQFEREKKKYKFFDGQWFVSKVQHFVKPAIGSYRQQLVIFRNFKQNV